IVMQMDGNFNNDEDYVRAYWPFEQIRWIDVVSREKGFMKDGKISVEVRFWISNMEGIKKLLRFDFADSTNPRNDIAIVIGGEKIYTSKAILAAHSPVFNAMFYSDFKEKNKEEIELKGVDREEFLEMLHVIYPSSKKITDKSAEYLLRLGDRFQIAILMDRVEEFLVNYYDHSNIGDADMLRIADKYRLHGLMERTLSELKTTEDFQEIEQSHVFDGLSPKTIRLLFTRHLYL
ncbi:hypothetical protein PMAYCL1PPCAC_24788, partial [Pristionchus mayeri]